MKMREFDGYIRLLDAIVHMAAKDHRKAVRLLRNNPEDRYAQYTKDETERFFRSDWFRFIADYADEAIDTAKKEGGSSQNAQGLRYPKRRSSRAG